jgi:NhaP-type Na+/H+ or K+/H+ antiporter
MTYAAQLIQTAATAILAGASIGWLAWWIRQHGPDKENR